MRPLSAALRFARDPLRVTVPRSVEAAQLTQRWTQGPPGQALGQGAGLGLAIVGRYAELLGARLSLEGGAQGTGLCASVRFQLAGALTDPC